MLMIFDSVACLKMLMLKFFNFVVVNFIISKNLKILKISGNKRPKNAKRCNNNLGVALLPKIQVTLFIIPLLYELIERELTRYKRLAKET